MIESTLLSLALIIPIAIVTFIILGIAALWAGFAFITWGEDGR